MLDLPNRRALLSGTPSWVLAQYAAAGTPPDLALDMAMGRAFVRGGYSGPLDAVLPVANSSGGYVDDNADLWSLKSPNMLRRSDRHMLVEESRTNGVLWNRDLTNAAWTKTNVSVAKDQTGIDGATNAASSVTATSGNGTVLQAITLGSSARCQSAFVKRISGSGTIQMTMDNGSTWTNVTVTASWAAVESPAQTLANPTVGFRIVTSGDAIAVDFVQNENGTSRSSPISTAGAAATRNADVISTRNISVGTTQTIYAKALAQAPTSFTSFGQAAWLSASANALNNRAGVFRNTGTGEARAFVNNNGATTTLASGSTWAQGAIGKIAVAVADGDQALSFNGNAVVTGSGSWPPAAAINQLDIGQFSLAYWNGGLMQIGVWLNHRVPNLNLQALTAP